MSQNHIALPALLVLGVALASCASSGMTENQSSGTAVGAMSGAVAGAVIAKNAGVSPLVGAVIGGVAGGMAGNIVGTLLDEEERRQLAFASQQAVVLPPMSSGKAVKPVRWQRVDAAKGNTITASGWVIPKGDVYPSSDGQECRDLVQTIQKDGKTVTNDVTACRKTASAGSGGWIIPNG